jgi:hypothetical protein
MLLMLMPARRIPLGASSSTTRLDALSLTMSLSKLLVQRDIWSERFQFDFFTSDFSRPDLVGPDSCYSHFLMQAWNSIGGEALSRQIKVL